MSPESNSSECLKERIEIVEQCTFLLETIHHLQEMKAVVFQASKVSKKPVRHAITEIYRKKVNDREYCFFHVKAISSTDYFGNNVMSTRLTLRTLRVTYH